MSMTEEHSRRKQSNEQRYRAGKNPAMSRESDRRGVCVCVCVCARVCAGTEKKRRSKETVSEGSWGQTTASALEVGRGTSDSRNSLTQQGRLSICTA